MKVESAPFFPKGGGGVRRLETVEGFSVCPLGWFVVLRGWFDALFFFVCVYLRVSA